MAKSVRFGDAKRVALPGSEKAPFTGGVTLHAAAGAKKARGGNVSVSVLVRRKEKLPRAVGAARLTPAQFARKHGADPAAVKMVKAFASEFGLVAEAPAAGRVAVRVSGPEEAMAQAFGVEFVRAEGYRTRAGSVMLPREMIGPVEAVLGLDNRPQAQAHFRVAKDAAASTSYTPVEVAALYGLPAGASGAGQTIGIVELGGGFRKADLTAYFKTLGLKAPKVTAVAVDGGKNTPGDANGADGEVMLDIEVCGAVAAGASLAVYFAPNTDQGFIDAISTAVHDTTNKPGVISISWGGPESSWTGQALTALDQACQAAAVLGVTITVACGDSGSTDGVTDGKNHVDFPASSPHVVACGGTKLVGSGTTIESETVWNELAANEGATGGGVSSVFALPTWQKGVGVPPPAGATGGRGTPDVAGDADPATGYSIRVDGQTLVIGGTSAVAPLWAGLLTVANAMAGATAGFVNPTLYGAARTAFRDITQGSNGGFNAGPGWDACSGLGSPQVSGLLSALGGRHKTGIKKSKSVKTGGEKKEKDRKGAERK